MSLFNINARPRVPWQEPEWLLRARRERAIRDWEKRQRQPPTRAEALRRRIGADAVFLAASGRVAVVHMSPGGGCLFVYREQMDLDDDGLRAFCRENARPGYFDLFEPLEPLPDVPERELDEATHGHSPR